jgi:hypothetical protein
MALHQIKDLHTALNFSINTMQTQINSLENSPKVKRRKISSDEIKDKSDHEISTELNGIKRKLREINYEQETSMKVENYIKLEFLLFQENNLKIEQERRMQEFINKIN